MKLLITILLIFLINNGWLFITQSEHYETIQELQKQSYIFTNIDLEKYYE